jgi:hypothetical protein
MERRWQSLAAIFVLAGCNMITGADNIVLVDEDSPSGSTGQSGAGGATTGSGTSTSGSAQGGATQAPTGVADGVTIDAIVVYQGVSRPIMVDGAAADSDVPVVADRPALWRVFYTTDGSYNGQPVTARITIGSAPPIEESATLGASSSEGDPASTINVEVSAEVMQAGASYRVELLHPLEQSSGQNSGARFPASEGELAPLGAQAAGVLKVTIVPIQYNADGSGRLPDVSSTQIQQYRDMFWGMYPIADIDLQVRAQVGWNSGVYANGSGWQNLLNAIADLRSNDGAAFNDYYYGAFEPAGSFGTYCGGGCVAGLGFVGGPQDAWSHAAIGVGYGGDTSAHTAAHELGHNHGREHAPCGTSGDANYPYSGAKIGVWGYDLVSGQLLDPNHVDLMSYCDPAWISDYNFRHIFERIQFVNGASFYTPPAQMNLTYQRVLVDSEGNASFLAPITLERPPLGEAINVDVETTSGFEQQTGQLVRYDHLEGGVLFVPPASQSIQALSAMIDGDMLYVSK